MILCQAPSTHTDNFTASVEKESEFSQGGSRANDMPMPLDLLENPALHPSLNQEGYTLQNSHQDKDYLRMLDLDQEQFRSIFLFF